MQLMKTPRSVDIEITNECNLRCAYCSHFGSASEVDRDIAKEEWLTFFQELGRCAVLDVTLQGGEPFYRKDLLELIEGIVKNRMRFSILSNGTLITDEVVKFLKKTGRCNSVQVSIDGSVPETHDVFRGKGNFERAVQGIEVLKRHGIPATVRVTIHRKNVRDLENVAKLLLEEIGLPGFSTNSASYMGLCRRNRDILQLTAKERITAMVTLLKLDRKYNGRISANAGPLAEGRIWFEMEKARREGLDRIPGRGVLSGCGGVMTKIAIRADGVIVPCCQMGHIELGRINRDSLVDVWQNSLELKRLRERVKIPLSDFPLCKDCEYINYCTGNCPALAYTLCGEENCPSPDACLKKFIANGGRLPGMRGPYGIKKARKEEKKSQK